MMRILRHGRPPIADVRVASFSNTLEVIEHDLLRSEIIEVGPVVIARTVHEPGWHWKTHLGPVLRTDLCETRHVGVVVEGAMGIRTRDGLEVELHVGEAYEVPAGHDGWVVGDVRCVVIDWAGARGWLAPLEVRKERVLASLLFTDIVDSTGRLRDLGDHAWGDLITTHNERVREAVATFGGGRLRLTGDGALAVFDGAGRAVRCAVAVRDLAFDLGTPVRAAVHTGEIEFVDQEIHGLAVHEAARILGIADENEVLVSAITRELVSGEGFAFEDRGEHELRGTNARRHLFRVTTR